MLPLHKSAIHQTGNLVRQINIKLPSEHLSMQPKWSKRSRIILTLQAQMIFHDLIHQQTLFTHSIILQLQRYIAVNTHSWHVVNKVLTSSMEAMFLVVSRFNASYCSHCHLHHHLLYNLHAPWLQEFWTPLSTCHTYYSCLITTSSTFFCKQ